MSSIDERHEKKPVVRVEVGTITIGAAVTTEVTETVIVNMTIKSIAVRVGNATNSPTHTLSIRDDNGTEHVSKASIADNAKTLLNSQKGTPDFGAVSINGTLTIGITPSGAPGTGGVDVNVDLFGV